MRIFSIFAITCCLFLAACSGSSTTSSLDVEKADSGETADIQNKVEISIDMKDTVVLQLLGPADMTDTDSSGHSFWRYYGKRAEYVYVSNRENGQTLVIGGYVADPVHPADSLDDPARRSPGLPLVMTIVFDPAKKVVDFNFAQMAF